MRGRGFLLGLDKQDALAGAADTTTVVPAMNFATKWRSAFAACTLALSSPAGAEQPSQSYGIELLRMEVALVAAAEAVEMCVAAGHPVAAAVVDRLGQTVVTLRADGGRPHALEAARRKAWTAASFGIPSSELGERAGGEDAGLRAIPGIMPLGGGFPIKRADGTLLGAIGVAGAGGTDQEEACARAGLAAIGQQ